jgi:hypothetical protein
MAGQAEASGGKPRCKLIGLERAPLEHAKIPVDALD